MKDLGEAVEQLSSRVDALEERVARLEGSVAGERQRPQEGFSTQTIPASQSGLRLTDVFAVIGKSLLGIAGAYVLRALAAGSLIPRPVIAIAGVLYALAWLLAAARTSSRRLAPGLYAATSALILVPMLWEMCLRFHVLSPGIAATVLAAYAAVATWLGWRDPRSPAFAFSYAGAAIAALTLSIATHAMAAFTLLLIGMLLACEIGRVLHRDFRIRAAVALAADSATWTVLFVYRVPAETRSDYSPISAGFLVAIGCLPFLVSFPGIVYRAMRLRQKLGVFDIAHGVLSFSLVALALYWILPLHGALVLGIICAVLAFVSYAAALGPLRRDAHSSNFNVASLWSAALMLSAAFLLLSPVAASVAICFLALGGILFGDRLQCRAAEFQGVLYLGIAAVLSGQIAYASHALIGPLPAFPAWPVLAASVAVIAAYAFADEAPAEPWQEQFLHFVPALLAAFSLAALLAHALVRSAAFIAPPADFHIAFLRTLIPHRIPAHAHRLPDCGGTGVRRSPLAASRA